MSMQNGAEVAAGHSGSGASRRKLALRLGALGVIVAGAYSLGHWRGRPSTASPVTAVPVPERFVGFEPGEIDLGDVPWYSQIPFGAVFENRGDTGVTIAAVRATCDCILTEPELYTDRAVAPGEAEEVTATLEVGGTLGEHFKEIELLLGSGQIHTFAVHYRGYATYEIKPDPLDFGRIEIDEPTDVVRSAVFLSETAEVVGEPTVDSPWLQAARYDREPGETEIVVSVRKRYLLHGKNIGKIRLTTSDPWRPEGDLVIVVDGCAQLRAVPARVFLRAGDERNVRFLTAEGAVPRIVSASCDDEAVEITVHPEGGSVLVRVGPDSIDRPVGVTAVDDRGMSSTFLVFPIQ